jgi:glycosyltransferase involved in cell wall biosynthesis
VITIYPIPQQLLTSPYLDQLYDPLAGQPDLRIRRIGFRAAVVELLAGRADARIAHWHFFDELTQRPALSATAARTLAFIALIRLLRARGVGLVWTAHNSEPHELRHARWAARAYQAMFGQAHAVIAHSAAAAALLRARYGAGPPLSVIPHGAYVGLYGPRRDKRASRAQLGLPEAGFVALALGTLRPYKGLEILLEAWQGGAGRLLIAGAAKDTGYATLLAARAAAIPGVDFRPQFVPDQALPTWLAAADVLVLPYRKLLTSGVLLWALSYGVPVVAPDVAPVRELVIDGRAGFLFTPADPTALRAALARARAHPDLAALGEAAYAAALPFAWPAIAAQTAALYRRVAAELRG